MKRKGLDNLAADIVADCGKAVALLAEKSDEQETTEYKEWVMTVGRKVAATAKEKDSVDGEKISPKEEALLQKVADALGL